MRIETIQGHEFVVLQPTMIAVSIAYAFGRRLPRPIYIMKANFKPVAGHVTRDERKENHGSIEENQ